MPIAYERLAAANPLGQPLVLIHGLGGDRNSWEPIASQLAKDRDVYLMELPGFGGSRPLAADVEPTPQALAAAVASQIEQLQIGPVHVAGVSLGSWVSLQLAVEGKALSVTALAPAGFWRKPLRPNSQLPRQIGRRLEPVLGLILRSKAARDSLLATSVAKPGKLSPATATKLIRAYVLASDFVRVDAAMRSRTFGTRTPLDAAARRIPIHVVWGGKDRLVVPPKEPLPESVKQHHLQDAGHLPQFDEPEAVVGIINQAMSEAASTAAQVSTVG